MDEFTNDGILKLNSNRLRYNNKTYSLFSVKPTEWQARKVRDDLRKHNYDTRITNKNNLWQVWWIT